VQDDCGIISDIDPLYDFAKLGTRQLALDGNYPNPFGEQTTIHFTLPEASEVTVSVFDIAGRKVATLVNQSLVAGTHDVQWNGRADSGQRLASGVYFYRIEAGDFSQTRRMTLVR
jgi:pullulanase/glycogen debranching enzyme